MAKESKSGAMKCVLDIRGYPWQAYKLPTDGCKARAVCEQRRALALQLASYANPDGTSITTGRDRLLKETGWTLRTLARRLAELQALGILTRQGLTAEHGTARRRLTMPGAGVPDSAAGVPDSGAAGVPDSGAGRPDSTAPSQQVGQIAPENGAGVPPSVAQNRSSTANQNPPPTATAKAERVEAFLLQNLQVLGVPNKAARVWMEQCTAQHGESATVETLRSFCNQPNGFGGIKNTWSLFLHECDTWLAQARQKMQGHTWRYENDAQYRAAVDASVAAQDAEMYARMIKATPQNGDGSSPYDYIPPNDSDQSPAAQEWRARNNPDVVAAKYAALEQAERDARATKFAHTPSKNADETVPGKTISDYL